MKIARIETVRVDVPLPGEGFRPAWGPGLLQRTWSNVLVKVFTDAGIVGYAAGHSFVSHIERSVAPYMIGRDPFALEYHHQVLTNAGGPFFIDIALWDISGNVLAHPQGMYLEYPHDPPVAPLQSFSALVTERPLTIDTEGYVHVTDKPGLGVELNEEIVDVTAPAGGGPSRPAAALFEGGGNPGSGRAGALLVKETRDPGRAYPPTILAARSRRSAGLTSDTSAYPRSPLRHRTTVNPRTVVADAAARPIGRRPRVGQASPSARNTKSEIEWSRRP